MITEQMLKEIWDTRFSITTPVPEDISNFEIWKNDAYYPVGSEGCLGLWTGRQKSRKTFALNCVIASAIGDCAVGPFSYKPNGGIILHFDTEQPKNRYMVGQRRLYKLAGSDMVTDYANYFSINLRPYNWQERRDVINATILYLQSKNKTIDLIVIDGVVDICEDFMSSDASRDTVQTLMKWSDMTKASIYCVLHLNKTGGEVRGHLGTELANKADFTISVAKKDDDSIYSTVKSKDSRYYPFPSFDLYQTKEGMLDEQQGDWQTLQTFDLGEELKEVNIIKSF